MRCRAQLAAPWLAILLVLACDDAADRAPVKAARDPDPVPVLTPEPLLAPRPSPAEIEDLRQSAEADASPENLLALADGLLDVDLVNEAESIYRRLARRPEVRTGAVVGLARIANRRGLNEQAVALFTRATEMEPEDQGAQYGLADTLLRAGRYRDAYRRYETVSDIRPGNQAERRLYGQAIYRMASLDLTLGGFKRSARMLEELLLDQPGHPSAHYVYAQVLLRLGRREDAMRELQTHLGLLARLPGQGTVATLD